MRIGEGADFREEFRAEFYTADDSRIFRQDERCVRKGTASGKIMQGAVGENPVRQNPFFFCQPEP